MVHADDRSCFRCCADPIRKNNGCVHASSPRRCDNGWSRRLASNSPGVPALAAANTIRRKSHSRTRRRAPRIVLAALVPRRAYSPDSACPAAHWKYSPAFAKLCLWYGLHRSSGRSALPQPDGARNTGGQSRAPSDQAQDSRGGSGYYQTTSSSCCRQSLTTTNRSIPDSAPHTSPGRPSNCRTDAPRLSLGKLSNVSARRIKTKDGVGEKVGHPDLVLIVDVDRVASALALGQAPDFPCFIHRVVATDFTAVPEAHPQEALGIRPNSSRPNAGPRWRHHQCITAYGIDFGDMVARERGIPDIAIRRRRDAVGPGAFRCLPGFDLATRRIDAAIDPVLAGEPENAFAVEGRGIEIGGREIPLATETASQLWSRDRNARLRFARRR